MADIRIFDTPDQLSRAAADLVVESALASVRDRGQFVWGLSGGSTPAMLYRALAEEQYAVRMPWDGTHVFWSDERWVPPDHPESNARMARDEMLARVPIPQGNVLPIVTAGSTPEDSAAAAEHGLRSLFHGEPRPDLLLLGIGDDGHTASLFPGTTALGERDRLFTANHVPRLGAWRITATVTLLNASRHVVFLVTGTTKAHALRQVLHPARAATSLPASMVRPADGRLTWLVDREAAAQLPRGN